jgi:hypothetical protein
MRPSVLRLDEIRQVALEHDTVVISWVRKIGAGSFSSRSSRSRIARRYSVLSWSIICKWWWPAFDPFWRTASRYRIPMAAWTFSTGSGCRSKWHSNV